MTPEQRLDRVERILGLFAREGRRQRVRSREQDGKINILIQSQMETSEQINKLTASQERTEEQINKLTASQKRTDQTLRSFIKSFGKDRNGLT